MIIDTFKIKGFWGRATVEGKMYPDVTVFIGDNGTGKTTLLNLLVAALQAHAPRLESIPFDAIEIVLKDLRDQRRRRTIRIVRKERDAPYPALSYTIGSKEFVLYSDYHRRAFIHERRNIYEEGPSQYRSQVVALRELLDEVVAISWISVYRQVSVDSRGDERPRLESNVDRRLDYLKDQLAKYQLKLERQIRIRTQRFQEAVMESLLYSEELDDLSDFDNIRRKVNLKEENEEDLIRAFEELGIGGKRTQVKKHFTAMRKAVKNIEASLKEHTGITLSDISPLPFATRTQRIVKLLTESEDDKEIIRRPIRSFLDILHRFVKKKRFEIEKETGELVVRVTHSEKPETLGLFELSSGEKQLLIQLLEVLLQEGKPMLFFADEPELSLHVEWQENLLRALRELNANSQIIVATHSPDIVSGYRNSVIDMEDIVTDGI